MPGAQFVVHLFVLHLALALAPWLPGDGSPTPVGAWPLQPRPPVVRGFDPPSSPYGSGHRGVDLGGPVGQPVHTALAGTVTYAGLLAGVPVVVVDHGTTRTTYQPVTPSVTVGTAVARGAVVGVLALTGSHCLPSACLHWGWIRNADHVYLDPLLLVGAGPVRLLPLSGLEMTASPPRPAADLGSLLALVALRW